MFYQISKKKGKYGFGALKCAGGYVRNDGGKLGRRKTIIIHCETYKHLVSINHDSTQLLRSKSFRQHWETLRWSTLDDWPTENDFRQSASSEQSTANDSRQAISDERLPVDNFRWTIRGSNGASNNRYNWASIGGSGNYSECTMQTFSNMVLHGI